MWFQITDQFSVQDVVESFAFRDTLCIAYMMLYNDDWDDVLQEYAVELLYRIRSLYSSEWNSHWEYDALLGTACYITCRYDERYEAYKRAFEKAEVKPPTLVIEFAHCAICPGAPPISYDKAIDLVLEVIKLVPYNNAISVLCMLYSFNGNRERFEYWQRVLNNQPEEKKFSSPSIDPPPFLVKYREDYLTKLKMDNA